PPRPFFFKDPATTEISPLSLHAALPISIELVQDLNTNGFAEVGEPVAAATRSAEHTSELQSRQYLVCRLLLARKRLPCISDNTNRHAVSRAFDIVSADFV